METRLQNVWTRARMAVGFALVTGAAWAQDAAEAAGNAVGAAGEGTGAPPESGVTLGKILFGGGPVAFLVWLLIFATSIATITLIVNSLMAIKREKLLPDELVEGVRDSLNDGDLNAALETCEASPGPLSTILMVGFSNITEGYEVIQEAVASSAELENEKLMQRVNYLNLCGQIAPMLGLMGTVIGMVGAFANLASLEGAAKSKALAQNISIALWTTCVGLIIAVPALVSYTLIKNYATRIVLEMEANVLDLIKVLRNAEVEDEGV